MEFFSTRNKVISINPNGLRSTSIELRERIWNVFYKEEYDYYDTVDYTSYTTGIEDMNFLLIRVQKMQTLKNYTSM